MVRRLRPIRSILKFDKKEWSQKVGLGIKAARTSGRFLITVFLAEVMPLYVLPESLGHLGWGDLLSFLPTEYSGEMFV